MSQVDPWEIRTLLARVLNAEVETPAAVNSVVLLILRPLSGARASLREDLTRFVLGNVEAVLRGETEVYEAYRDMLKCQMSAALGVEALSAFLASSPDSRAPVLVPEDRGGL